MFNAKFLAEGITSKITLFISAVHVFFHVSIFPPDFFLILYRFCHDFIQIFKKLTLSKFYPGFILIFEKIWIKFGWSWKNTFSNFSCMFLNHNIFFSNLNSNSSTFLGMRNLQEQVKKHSFKPKIVLTFHCLNRLF